MKKHFSLKNCIYIYRHDIKRIFSSVIGVVIIFGLCVVPCLYAWFNIFSNWDPYGPESTSRIRVAVATDDEGAEILGLKMNVGDKVIEALQANDSIGWIFVDSQEEVYRLVNSGNCYAGLLVPKDFTEDVLSFIILDFEHPEIVYYENAKKNAVAPKITGKAKTAVQEEVNATFVKTIASTAGTLLEIMDANGLDFEGTVESLYEKSKKLSSKLEEIDGLMGSTCRLLDATEELMLNTGTLTANIADTSYRSANLSKTLSDDAQLLNSQIKMSYNELKTQLIDEDSKLAEIDSVLSDETISDAEKETAKKELSEYIAQHQNSTTDSFTQMIDSFISGDTDMSRTALVIGLIECRRSVLNQLYEISTNITPSVSRSLDNISGVSQNVADSFYGAGDEISGLSQTLYGVITPMSTLESNIYDARKDMLNIREQLSRITDALEKLKDSEYIKELSDSLIDNSDNIAPYFESPIKMDTFVMYPIDNYGSAMTPFYTVLAQWVGALFCSALLKARVKKEHSPDNLTIPEEFFGRFGLFFSVCMIQALLIAVGDLFYIDIYCLHPGLFILSACVTGLCFAMINYSLLFSFEKIGLGASVIIMVIQVAGSGGSYPVDVVPKVFRIMYPYMPFNYAMNSMREAIAGTYGNNYSDYIISLLKITLIFTVLGLSAYKPMHWLNSKISESTEKSKIML